MKIGLHDFVGVIGKNGYEVVYEMTDNQVTTVGLNLTEDRDSVILVASTHNIEDLKRVPVSAINIAGPLYNFREKLVHDLCNDFIYGIHSMV